MPTSSFTPHQAIELLVEGNRRYTAGKAQHPHQSIERCAETLSGQRPFAILLSCADSRVPPEIIFDQGIGDLFIIRNAGGILDEVVLGSIEYGIERLDIPLVMVLGHTKCGAVTAAVKASEAPGHIDRIVKTILPAIESSKSLPGDPVLNAVIANVALSTEQLKNSQPFLAERVKLGKIQIVGAVYHLDSGEVKLL
ncbi:MAG: carbonic anhydrase [Chloroflexota bacterium]